jgi:hypothetical protein
MLIVGVGWKQFLERLHKLVERIATMVEPSAEALVEVASRGVIGVVKGFLKPRQDIPKLLCNELANVDDIHTGLGGELQGNLCSRGYHD